MNQRGSGRCPFLPGLILVMASVLVLGACAGSPDASPDQGASALSPRDLNRLERTAAEYLEEGSCVRAAHTFEAVLENDPNRLSAMAGLASAQWCREEYREASKTLAGAAELAGSNAAPHVAGIRSALEIIAAERQAEQALLVEERLPPPVQDAVALVSVHDAEGDVGAKESAVAHLLASALAKADIGLASTRMAAALARRLEPGRRAVTDRHTARRIARLTGASYALIGSRSLENELVLTVLPVVPEGARLEYYSRMAERVRNQAVKDAENEALLLRRLEAIDRGVEYFEAKELIPRLLVQRDVLCKRISKLMETGRVESSKETLEELRALDMQIEETSERIKGFKRELFELEFNVFNITPDFLQKEIPRVQAELAKVRENLKKLAELTDTIKIRQVRLIPDSGVKLHLPALCSPPELWQEVAAEKVQRLIRPETPPSPGFAARALGCAGVLNPADEDRVHSLGLGVQAMDQGDYGSARLHFARSRGLGTEPLPPEEIDPRELAAMPPGRAALAVYPRLMALLGASDDS